MSEQNTGGGAAHDPEPRSAADGLSARQKEDFLAEPTRRFDLNEEIESLRHDIGWTRNGHSARTLVKQEGLRVVLISLARGARMGEHKADAPVTIQTVAGSVRLWLGERAIALPLGGLLLLERALPHDVEAVEESAILLTVAWPG